MNLTEITAREPWERFQTSQAWAQFTQSWAWGEFRASRGCPVRRFALVDDSGQWLAAVQMEYRKKKFVGGYWFAPRGPVISDHLEPAEQVEVFRASMERLQTMHLARALFWRVEPPLDLARVEGVFPPAFRRVPALNPAATMRLDLRPSQEALLANFHQKTRYNIRVAERHGVKIRTLSYAKDLKAFVQLMNETAERNEFVQQQGEYLEATFQWLMDHDMARLRLAEREDEVLAANLEIRYGDTVTYLYGSSSSKNRQFMAPFALHWDAITEAQRDGYRFYDFWGANPATKASFYYKKSWEGISRFKAGWGAEHVHLPGTWDLPFFLPLYRLAFLKYFWRG